MRICSANYPHFLLMANELNLAGDYIATMRIYDETDSLVWTKTWEQNAAYAGFASKGFDCNATRLYMGFGVLDSLSSSISHGILPSLSKYKWHDNAGTIDNPPILEFEKTYLESTASNDSSFLFIDFSF